jgi:hypothetical protein
MLNFTENNFFLNDINLNNFNDYCKAIHDYQLKNNTVYHQWNSLVKNDSSFTNYSFLPIKFFKELAVKAGTFKEQVIFESSGTTNTINSKHYVKNIQLYENSFYTTFKNFYGDVKDWCVIGLLPSYLERNNSSLVYMTKYLIEQSQHPSSGFYLYNFQALKETLQALTIEGQKVWLIGVTFALLDFADYFDRAFGLDNVTIVETGGMKGRKQEITRMELHNHLFQKLGVSKIHSEYGMTELFSQAYALHNGVFIAPPWMKVLVRNEEDPFEIKFSGKGLLNIIDLANLHTCSFIATDDVGIVHDDGSFEVLGRADNSDIRGCSLLTV